MKLRQEVFVADKGKKSVGEQLFEKIMGLASPVPPTLINIRCGGGSSIAAVPIERKDEFETRTGFGGLLFPKHEKQFESERATFVQEVEKNAICIHQRGYGVTDANSHKPWLSTGQVAPCIACMIYCSDLKMGALSHFDANMNEQSVVSIIDEFPRDVTLNIHFFGGKEEQSKKTCIGLLQALYDMDSHSQNTRQFSIQTFDVIDRPHGSEVALDTKTGKIYPSFSASTIFFDSGFRRLADGIYRTGDGVAMANQCEEMKNETLRKQARQVRKQFDGRAQHYQSFQEDVEKIIYEVTATMAMQRANNKGDKALIMKTLKDLDAPELIEANLRSYLGLSNTTSKAGDKRYLVEVIVIAILNDPALLAPEAVAWRERTEQK